MSDRMDLAAIAWEQKGGELPDWIIALVHACDQPGSSQNRIAKRIGYEGGVVSSVIRNSYKASTDQIEERVRAILMPTEIQCPAQGQIDTAACMKWRGHAKALTSASPSRVSMFVACNKCPRHIGEDS